MQGTVHTSLLQLGTELLSNTVEREYASIQSPDKQNIQLPYATMTEPPNTRQTQCGWMSMLVLLKDEMFLVIKIYKKISKQLLNRKGF